MSGTITILGTRHNSEKSFEDVREAIPKRQPDIVAPELPPRFFDANSPDWTVKAALNPRRDETLIGLIAQRVTLDDVYWKIEEMPLAAQIAAEEDIPVALIDQQFPRSMDQNGRALFADLFRTLQVLQTEVNVHRNLVSKRRWKALLKRDLWYGGTATSPLFTYFYELQKQGVINPLDHEQRKNAEKQFDERQVITKLDIIRQLLPNLMDSNIDARDEQMAGHLRWLADEGYDVLTFVGAGHVEGIRQFLEDERPLREQFVREPTVVNPSEIPVDAD